ncbi:ABC transporter ATP-binding protein [Moritella yayanosii]|uniref:Putative iron-dicitrate ABC transporter (ATP-binding protein) n=1 Tax=Moritella yayanosii TaxID=69539 RepID=A0A330LJ97_9GAMM|nr:ABC transporter ATP-binding protein [Moritella yayanosii]SQD76659.1 putative iron-dicitrate ABC transporter (ATP-binding protein) [Moritella yayanosii]
MHLQINQLNWSVTHKAILKNINMTVKPGQFVGLIGANGSGKSSLLRCAYRRYQPDSGQVLLNQVDIHTLSAKHVAQHVAVVLQEIPAEFGFTVKEVIAMGLTPHQGLFSKSTTYQHRIDDALHKVNLTAHQNQCFDLLSGGEKQRCLLARALVQQPQLLILDEPTNHLDIHYQYELLDLIASLGISVLCTLHDLNIAARYCDHLYLIDDGEIVLQGSPNQVLTEHTLLRYFSMDAIVRQHSHNNIPDIRYIAPVKSSATSY